MAIEQLKMIGTVMINAKLQAYNDLLAEIDTEGYGTIAQIKGVLHSSIESLEKLKGKADE